MWPPPTRSRGNLVLFPREEKTGLLGEALCSVEIPQAACVKWRE